MQPTAESAPPCSGDCWRLQTSGAADAEAVANKPPHSTSAAVGTTAVAHPDVASASAANATAGEASICQPLDQDKAQTVENSNSNPLGWSQYELGVLRSGLQLFGRDACRLALLLDGRSCVEVHRHLQLTVDDVAPAVAHPAQREATANKRKAKVNVSAGTYSTAHCTATVDSAMEALSKVLMFRQLLCS